jgi:putative cardiolipin synthase
MGLLIDSPTLAQRMADFFATEVPKNAYEVRLVAGDDDLEWIERTPSGEVRHDSEPGVGFFRGLWVGFLSILPIDWLL